MKFQSFTYYQKNNSFYNTITRNIICPQIRDSNYEKERWKKKKKMKSKGIKKKSLFERFMSQRSIQIDRAKGTREEA